MKKFKIPPATLEHFGGEEITSALQQGRIIKELIGNYYVQLEELAAALKGKTPLDSCRAVFDFTYKHIATAAEPTLTMKTPARTWHDKIASVSDVCIFIGSLLKELEIPFVVRLARFKGQRHFSHAYIVATPGHFEIAMDLEMEKLNQEHEGIVEKKDL